MKRKVKSGKNISVDVNLNISPPQQEAEDPKHKERRERKWNIALFFFLTCIAAGIYAISIWNSLEEATPFDVFLFFYAIIGAPVCLVVMGVAHYIENPNTWPSPPWLW